jgi:uncharacterized protein involved in exopolysaccharide biosynthesis
MLVKMIAGSLSLLAFSVATFAGVWAGNDISTVLLRAWWALILFLIFGTLIGWVAKLALDEYLTRNHQQIVDQLQQGFGNTIGKAPQPGSATDTAAGVKNNVGSNTLG